MSITNSNDTTLVQPGYIYTICGTGVRGYSGDHGLAIDATIKGPQTVVLGSDKDKDNIADFVYFSDYNNVVRKFSQYTGEITTVVGNGTVGYSGDGSDPLHAKLYGPLGLALDSDDNIYISDTFNNVVRFVNIAENKISTIVGNGTAGFDGINSHISPTNTMLNTPMGLAISNFNNALFISDFYNYCIRRYDITNKVLSVYAGKCGQRGYEGDTGLATEALMTSVYDIAIDNAENLYFSDVPNNVVRRVDHATGIITTVAGKQGVFDYSGDGGSALLAGFDLISAIALDSTGNLFISDSGANRIRIVNKDSGIISTVVGSGYGGFEGDGGFAILAGIKSPYGLTIDHFDNVYIADTDNNRIRKAIYKTVEGQMVQHPQPNHRPTESPTFAFNDNLVTYSRMINTIAGSGKDPGYSDDGTIAVHATLNSPQAIALSNVDLNRDNTADFIYFTDYNNQVRRFSQYTNSPLFTVAGNNKVGYTGDNGPADEASLFGPLGLALDIADNLFIADTYNNVIRRVDVQTSIITTIAGNSTAGFHGENIDALQAMLKTPFTVVASKLSPFLYIGDSFNYCIRKVDLQTQIISTYAGKCTQEGFSGDGGKAIEALMSAPFDITLDNWDNLYFADVSNNLVRKIDHSSGVITTLAGKYKVYDYSGDGGSAVAAGFDMVTAVAVDNYGDIYVADSGGNRIRKVYIESGLIYTIAGTGKAGYEGDGGLAIGSVLNNPLAMAIDPGLNVYIVDSNNNRIRKISTEVNGQTSPLPVAAPTEAPSDIAVVTNSKAPSTAPVAAPSELPSADNVASDSPSFAPTLSPVADSVLSETPSFAPTLAPVADSVISEMPTIAQTETYRPGYNPTPYPSLFPTALPTEVKTSGGNTPIINQQNSSSMTQLFAVIILAVATLLTIVACTWFCRRKNRSIKQLNPRRNRPLASHRYKQIATDDEIDGDLELNEQSGLRDTESV